MNNQNNGHTFSDSNLLNYKLGKMKKLKLKPINQDNFNSNIGSIFHKKRRNFDIFSPKPDVEEIPCFSFENDRNINKYKNNINNKSAFVEKNEQEYLRYIKKFERPKQTAINSPYLFFQEKNNKNYNYNTTNNNITKNIDDIYNNNKNNIISNNYNTLINERKNVESILDNNNNKNLMTNNNKKNITLDANNYLNNLNSNIKKISLKKNHFNTLSKNIFNNKNNNGQDIKKPKVLIPSLSSNEIFSIKNTEITNPSSYYKKYDEDYYRYRLEQKKYLDYNYEFMMNNEYQRNKKEPNVNPYNPKNNVFWANKSDLVHNPILNPINHYGYNKYLKKELDMRENERLKKLLKNYLYPNKSTNFNENNTKNNSENIVNNNINSIENNENDKNNNQYKEYEYKNSPLFQAGNQFVNN